MGAKGHGARELEEPAGDRCGMPRFVGHCTLVYIYNNPVISPGRGETVEVFKKLAKVKGEDMTPDELIGLQVNLHPAL